MTAHEYLSQYLALDCDVARWRREIKKARSVGQWKDAPLPISNPGGRGGPSAQTLGDLMSAIIIQKVDGDIRRVRALEDRVEAALERQLRIVHAIDAVPSNVSRRMLDMRYLQGMRNEDIAEAMQVSVSTVRRFLTQGLSWVVDDEVN